MYPPGTKMTLTPEQSPILKSTTMTCKLHNIKGASPVKGVLCKKTTSSKKVTKEVTKETKEEILPQVKRWRTFNEKLEKCAYNKKPLKRLKPTTH